MGIEEGEYQSEWSNTIIKCIEWVNTTQQHNINTGITINNVNESTIINNHQNNNDTEYNGM